MEGSFGRVHLNGKLIALQYVTELSLVQAELKRELGDCIAARLLIVA